MARSHARLKLGAMSTDEDLRGLSPHAKLVYVFLLQDTYLNPAGAIVMCEQVWAEDLGLSDDEFAKALAELLDSRFVVIDRRTRELLVRTFIRNDGIADQPNMLKQSLTHARQIKSGTVRHALAEELRRFPPAPEQKTVRAGGKHRVMIYPDPHACAEEIDPWPPSPPPGKPSANPSAIPSENPSRNPSPPEPFAEGIPEPRGEGEGEGEGFTSRSSSVGEDTTAPRKRGSRLPEDWAVTDELVAWCRQRCPDVDGRTETERFINYFLAAPGQKGVKLDWDRTWKNWMLEEQKRAERRPAHLRAVPTTAPLKRDPDAALAELRADGDAHRAGRILGRPYIEPSQPMDDDSDPYAWSRVRAVEWIDEHADQIRAELAAGRRTG